MTGKELTGLLLLSLLGIALSNVQEIKDSPETPPRAEEERRIIRSDNTSLAGDVTISVERPDTRFVRNRTSSSKTVADMVHKFFAEKAREDAYQATEAEDNPHSLCYLMLDLQGVVTSICSGTLVTPGWVVTAAHCLMDQPVSEVKVFAGIAYNVLTHWGKPPKHAQVRASREFFAHPRYDPADTDWDVGLIKIDPPFRRTRFVRPLPMTSTPWDHSGYRACRLTAFGRVRERLDGPDDFIRKTQELLVKKPCACSGYLEGKMGADKLSRNICLKPTADFGICSGDSGGGLVCDGELKAVVSFSLPIEDFSKCRLRGPSGSGECGDVDMFDIWQDLYPSLGWIKKNAFQVNGTVESTTEGTASGMLGLSMPLSVIVFGLINLA